MNISYEEIGHMSVTFPAGACEVGKVCKVNAEGAVTGCPGGDCFCGVVESIHGSFAGVQIHGFAKVGYSGTAPTCGYVKLAANGGGGVAVNTSGKEYLVVKVDTAEKTAVIEL